MSIHRFSNLILFLFVLNIAYLVTGCENDIDAVNAFIEQEQLTTETARDVKMIYSDSAVVRVQIEGPKMIRYLDRNDPRQEFVEGVRVVFYTPAQKLQSILTAKKAVRFERRNEIVVSDSVVWESTEGERLETEELIWEESKERVYSNKFVKITQPDDVIYGYGFETNQDFTRWTINAFKGDLGVKDEEKEQE